MYKPQYGSVKPLLNLGHDRRSFVRSKNEPNDQSNWPRHQEYKQGDKTAGLTSGFSIFVRPDDAPYDANKNQDDENIEKGRSNSVHTDIQTPLTC